MALTPHGTLIVHDGFGGTISSLNGRTPDTVDTPSVAWVDLTTSTKFITGTVAGTVSAAGANRVASINAGGFEITVEARFNFAGQTAAAREAGLVVAMATALTAISAGCYRLDVLPNATGNKFLLKRQSTTLTGSTSFTPSNSADFLVQLTMRLNGSTQPQFSARYDALGGSGWQQITFADTNSTNSSASDTYTDDSVSLISTGNFVGMFVDATTERLDDFKVYDASSGGGGGGGSTDDEDAWIVS